MTLGVKLVSLCITSKNGGCILHQWTLCLCINTNRRSYILVRVPYINGNG